MNQVLLTRGCDRYLRGKNDITALDFAYKKKSSVCIDLLEGPRTFCCIILALFVALSALFSVPVLCALVLGSFFAVSAFCFVVCGNFGVVLADLLLF